MTAPGHTLVTSRANDERRRAARTAEVAKRHEEWVDVEPFLRAFHLRMAAIHRQVQRLHLTAAALHTARADRIPTRVDTPRGVLPDQRQRPAPPVGVGRRPIPRTVDSVATSVLDRPAPHSRAHMLLVTLVDLLEVHADVSGFLSGFVTQCVAMLDVTAAATLIADDREALGIGSWSSEPARTFTGVELQRGEGPSVECHRTGEHRVYPTASALATHWPHLAETARAANIAVVYAIPLRRRDQVLGVLTLLDHGPNRLGDDALQFVNLLTAAATIGLTNQRLIAHHQRTAAQLQFALTSRIGIEQAKGMLAERLGIPVSAAFELLRGYSRANNRNLREVAAEFVDRDLDIVARGAGRLAPPPRNPLRTEARRGGQP